MSVNKGNSNDNDKTGDIMSWVIIIILMFVLPPLGWIFLLLKLGVFTNKKVKQGSGKSLDTSTVTQVNNKKKKQKSRLDKKTGKGLSVFLLLVSIAMAVAGIGALSNWIASGFSNLPELIFGMFYMLGGSISFLSRNIVSKRFARYKNYYAFIGERGVVPIYEIAQISGLPAKKVINDLQAMINSGYLDPGAYIDYELECLVISAEDAVKLRQEIKGSQSTAVVLDQSGDMTVSQDVATLAELREADSFIKDEAISSKVHRLVELTEKIFKIVEESPEKQPQIRRFSSYYLPTTLKLVRSYATLEKQGVKGENIMSTKKNIGDILDTLTIGFEQQLDQLFKSDAIDIASDINVLENLMQQDGLTSDKSEFQVSASAGGGTF